MTEPDGATHSALHDPDGLGPQVRLSRAHARTTPPAAPAAVPAADRPGGGAVRSAVEIARQRWGTPVGPVTTAPADTGHDSPPGGPASRRDPLAAWRIWSEPSPAMSAIWADLVDGARQQAAYGGLWLVPYWLFGIPGFVAACAARLLLDSSARPGRFAALLFAVALFTAGLYVAGLI